MKPFRPTALLITLFAATLACSGCMRPVEDLAYSGIIWSESDQSTPHRCRSSVSQSTQKGCRATSSAARN
jgi:hypothetical protein